MMQKNYSNTLLADIIFSQKVVIKAHPGTGKTTTILQAAEEMLKDSENRKIVIITFTKKAAEELKERLNSNRQPYFVGTIHSFCASEINKRANSKNLINRIMNDRQMKGLINSILEELDIVLVRRQLNKVYDMIITGKRISDEDNFAKQTVEIEKRYIARKKQLGLFDFRDYPEYLLGKMEEENLYLDALFVDEAQDLDEIQYNFIRKINAKKKVLIGDPKQSIYIFRGAYPNIFDQFTDYRQLELTTNYRSKQEIMDFVGVDIKCARGYGGTAGYGVDTINQDVVILCRSNKEVRAIQKHHPHVMTIHASKGLEFPSVVVIDFKIGSKEDENIKFVGLTRACDHVRIAKLEEVITKFKTLKS